VPRNAISHARLMRESTDRVQTALRSDDAKEQMVANRILANPKTWQRWEIEHSGLMRQVAHVGFKGTQVDVLKQTTFGLIHRKALFEYLRSDGVRGRVRMQILAHFHPERSYSHAVVAEHDVYLRKACSYLCASHVGSAVVHDDGFLDPMQCYINLYAEYFKLYCTSYFLEDGAEVPSQAALLPLLKFQLNEWRQAIINPRRELSRLMRDAELRRPIGDTQRLPVAGLRAKFGA
jgi:hypothetical protein